MPAQNVSTPSLKEEYPFQKGKAKLTASEDYIETSSYLQDLQARARAADELRSSHTSLATPSIIEEDPGTDDDDWWYKGMDTLLLTRSGERRYVGKAAAMYLAQKLSPTPETSLAWDSNPMYKSSLKRPASLTLPQLPPYDFARRLFAAQHIYIGTIFSFLQPHVWATRWRNSSENTDGNPGSFITAAAQ